MIFIKKSKLFVILVLSLMQYAQARSMSVSQIGDVRIQQTDDKWICDQIECPLDADRCYVSKSNEKSPSILVRTNICYSKDNKILTEKTSTTPTDPNNKINMHIVSHANGGVSSFNGNFNGAGTFDEEKFKEELHRNLGHMEVNLQQQMAGINQGLDEEMKNLHANLNKMNENINKNLQHQMHNLQENLTFDVNDDNADDDADY